MINKKKKLKRRSNFSIVIPQISRQMKCFADLEGFLGLNHTNDIIIQQAGIPLELYFILYSCITFLTG